MVVDKEVDKDKGKDKDKDKEVDKNVAKQLDFTILISVLIFLIRIVTARAGYVELAAHLSCHDWTIGLFSTRLNCAFLPNYTLLDSQLFLLDCFFLKEGME